MKLPAATFAALLLAAPLVTADAWAKLPPLSPEAQAKADEAKAKTAWTDKVAAFQLCRAMDRAADNYFKTAKAANRETKPPMPTPPCADPGPFAAAGSAAAPTPAAQKPTEQSGAHSPSGNATTPPSATPATQAQTQGAKK